MLTPSWSVLGAPERQPRCFFARRGLGVLSAQERLDCVTEWVVGARADVDDRVDGHRIVSMPRYGSYTVRGHEPHLPSFFAFARLASASRRAAYLPLRPS